MGIDIALSRALPESAGDWFAQEPPFDPYDDAGSFTQSTEDLIERMANDEYRRLRAREIARDRLSAERQELAVPFDAGTLADVLARPAEPANRIDDLIPWEASTLLIAQRKAGKTTTVLNLSRSLLTGSDFLGRFGVRPVQGDICILNFEVSAAMLARWADEHQVPANRLYLVNLRGRRNPLTNPEDRALLGAQLKARGVETVIVDPFGRAYSGTNQNDAGEVGNWLVNLDQFARGEVGARDLILTAHAGWNGERTRGSSALEDWADSVITLTKDDTEKGDGQRYLRAFGRDVDLEEDRLDYDHDTRTLVLSGSGSRRQARVVEHHQQLDQDVLNLITQVPGLNGSQLGEHLRQRGISFQGGDERKAAKRLVDADKVHFTTGSRNTKSYFPGSPPELSRTLPAVQPTNYPDPSFKGRDRSGPNSGRELSRATCNQCGDPMTITDPGQTTHPTCEGEAA